jgi:hypothetical protein
VTLAENLNIINNYIIIIRICKSAKVTYVWRRRILALLIITLLLLGTVNQLRSPMSGGGES